MPSSERWGETGERVLTLVLALVCIGVLVVWAGAQLAALAFGAHHTLGAGFVDAFSASAGLVTDPWHPRDAWPPDSRAALPGAAAYWFSTGLIIAIALCVLVPVGVLIFRVWLPWRSSGLVRRRRMGIDPEAAFATAHDLAPIWSSVPASGRIVLGKVRLGRRAWRSVATENPALPLDPSVPRLSRRVAGRRRGQRGSVIVLGPSQCGKTAAVAIPAILEWPGPVVALSVKTDLLGATIAHRRRVGDVRVFDPAAVTREPRAAWSPLQESTSLPGARQAARSIANATSWTQEAGELGFWTDAGEDLLANLFWVAATAGLGMDTVVTWIQTMDRKTVRQLLAPVAERALGDLGTEAGVVLEAFDGLWRSDAKQISSVYLTARTMIRPWQEPAVQSTADASTRPDGRRDGIDLAWLLDLTTATEAGAVPGWNTLYLCADLDEADRLAPVLGGLLDGLLRQAYARAGVLNAALDPPLLVVVDEAGNWPIRSLPGRISTCAGLGIQLLLVFQSKAQIDAAYGRRADIVLANAVTKIFFAGLSDESTLRYAAQLLGEEHVTARSVSYDTGAAAIPVAGPRSVSHQPTRVELLPSSALRRILPGQALLIHNTLPPAQIHGRFWFREPYLSQLAAGEPPALTGPAVQTGPDG
jgi:type IV secretion system protein VirD4